MKRAGKYPPSRPWKHWEHKGARHFALLPVRLTSGRRAWLRHVLRMEIDYGGTFSPEIFIAYAEIPPPA